MQKTPLEIVDLFCGAGGTSSGIVKACEKLEIDIRLTAINHWDVAIATHSKNHSEARHLCESLDNVDPRKLYPKRHIHLMVASPECTHHSVARGGRPINDQSRASAWHIVRWAEALYIENILIENVPEFRNWGPIDPMTNKVVPELKGQTYKAFLNALRSLGYTVEDRILCAADYGEATTRRRLFVIARKTGSIVWPAATHYDPKLGKIPGRRPWRAAREIIDWEIAGQSIFNRKKPLAAKTLSRIAAGLAKFSGVDIEPFLVMLYGTGKDRSVERPLPTVTANGQHIAVCVPFLVGLEHTGANGKQVRKATDPVPTITAHARIGIVEPFLVGVGGPEGSGHPRSTKEPLRTVLTENHQAVIEPFLMAVNHGDTKGQKNARVRDLCDPLNTITCKGSMALIEPFFVKYYGNGNSIKSTKEPLDTVTTKDRFLLTEGVTVEDKTGKKYLLDINLRMLQPHELAAAQGFDPSYEFTGGRANQVKQIGNAVPVRLAKSLVQAILGDHIAQAS